MGKLRIGYEDVAQVREGGSIVLTLAAGHIARRYNILPVIGDLEGLIYEASVKLGSVEIQCEEIAEELREYLNNVRGILRMRFEDSWVKLPLPVVECTE
jgi:hypothetical protein